MLKIKTFGWRSENLDVISRIEDGFRKLNCELVDTDPDIIYKNEDFFEEALEYSKNYPKAFIIFNILDLQLNNHNYSLEKLKLQLNQADKVTCISRTVQKQLLDLLGVQAEVIYNPMKPVSYIPDNPRDFFSLFVGRALSPNKRVTEIVFPLYKELYKYFGDRSVHFVGPENPGFGIWHGIVNDKELNHLYNNSAFGLISSKEEGLNLPLIEMICSGCIPIICRDMSTAEEFGIPELLCDPNPEAMFYKMKEVSNNFNYYNDILYIKSLVYREQFSNINVAKRILDIYLKNNE